MQSSLRGEEKSQRMLTLVHPRVFTDARYLNLQKAIMEAHMSPIDAMRYAALGLMVLLWRETQSRLKDEAYPEEIDDWLHPGATLLLAQAKLIELMPNGKYYIKGSRDRVYKLIRRAEMASAAGKLGADRRWQRNRVLDPKRT